MRGGRLRRKTAMCGRGDCTLTYREYIGDIIPAGSIGSLRRFPSGVAYRITPGGVTIGVWGGRPKARPVRARAIIVAGRFVE